MRNPFSKPISQEAPSTLSAEASSSSGSTLSLNHGEEERPIPIRDRTFGSRTNSTAFRSNLRDESAYIDFRERRLRHSSLNTEPIEKPWVGIKDPREKWATWIPFIGIIIGTIVMIGLAALGYLQRNKHTYKLVFEDNFMGTSINTDIWSHEVQLNGFGNGEFDWTTTSDKNSFVSDGMLHIKPTLTNTTSGLTDAQIYDGYTVNLTTTGECTSKYDSDCSLTSNRTTGAIIPPIQSARLTTKNSHSIKYGRIEVEAKLPRGDWLWPAIWMLPVNNTYGEWPRSGEIDIVESRGNNRSYTANGNQFVSTALHWGPYPALDKYLITNKAVIQPLTDFTQGFHTFGMEWSEDYFYTYIDTPLRQIFYYKWPKSLWNTGGFPASLGLTPLYDIWNKKVAPFDQEFYLILNVAVGGTNGFFPDGQGHKPWSNGDTVAAKYHFYQDFSQWWGTWNSKKSGTDDAEMKVRSVKMYQQVK